MATIGWIKVGAAVDTSQFAAGMTQMAAMTTKFQTGMKITEKAFLATAGLIGSAVDKIALSITNGIAFLGKWSVALFGLATGALLAWTRHTVGGIAEQSKLASRLGMTTESFQKLSYAARLSGIDQEQLTGSLEKMEERLAEVATEGAGPAANALKMMGLDARKLAMMNPADAFLTMTAAIEKLPNAMQRVQVAKEIFGKSGQGMVNLVLQGTDALKAMGVQASASGVALGALDNAKVKEANIAFIQIGAAIEGIGNKIAVGMAPYITAAADQFMKFQNTGTGMGSAITQAIDWISIAIGKMGDAWQDMKLVFLSAQISITEGLISMIKNFPGFAEGMTKVTNALAGTQNSVEDFKRTWLEDLGRMKEAQEKTFGKEGAKTPFSETVRKIKDDIEKAAGERAKFNVDKSNAASGGPAGELTPRLATTSFASASESGTAAAYSARVGAQARLFDSKQNLIAENTGKTAAATERIAIAVESQKMRAGGPVDGIQYREQASGR